jgi:hypothetical protein
MFRSLDRKETTCSYVCNFHSWVPNRLCQWLAPVDCREVDKQWKWRTVRWRITFLLLFHYLLLKFFPSFRLAVRQAQHFNAQKRHFQRYPSEDNPLWPSVLRFLRIRMFLGLQDPVLLRISSSKNCQKNLDSYCFVASLWLFIFEKWCKCTFIKL